MKVVVAVDSFKGSMTSMEAGMAVKAGILAAKKDAEVIVKPLADGGEGTTDALIEGLKGERVDVTVTGPYHEPVQAYYGYLRESNTAVMEMATAAGITLSDKKEPMTATTYGVGELILHAIGRGIRNFIIGIGGSATNDGGVGMLKALGYRFLDEKGEDAGEGGQALAKIVSVEISDKKQLLSQCNFRIACDVTNPLCGSQGATYIYGPQKGVTPDILPVLDAGMKNYAEVTAKVTDKDNQNAAGAGAAGGLGFAFLNYLDGELTPGIQLILDAVHVGDEMKDADKLYDKVRAATDRFIESNEFKVMYTVSGGIVPFAALKGNQYAEALKLTDFALNEAKKLGRNRCYIFNGETYRKFLRKREITQELREAVINGFQGFTAFYQPVFAEDKKVPYGAEALMRFTSEKFGMISPAEFIPILEETGLIIPAGRWMMKEAMGKCSEIRKILSEFRMSINISQVQASKSDVIQDISAEMKRTGLPLEAVIVELTESDLLEQNINEKHFLTELKRMGISLALDDFGTGYSNFHYLSELKPEIIKIDRSFTAKAVADEQEYYLLNQFCTMIHNLDMKICIEGVENAQEWLKIRKLSPEFTQGYFWGKPCGYEEFVRKFVQEK